MKLVRQLKKFTADESHEEGFTLIELVIVVAIIGILSAVAIPAFGAIQENSRMAVLGTTAKNTYAAVAATYYGDSDLTTDEIVASANNEEITVTINSGWVNEEDICITAAWQNGNPSTVKNFGPGC